MKSTVIVCSVCGGNGIVDVVTEINRERRDVKIDCEKCKGSGRLHELSITVPFHIDQKHLHKMQMQLYEIQQEGNDRLTEIKQQKHESIKRI